MRRIGFIQPKLIGFGGVEMYGMHVVQALSRHYPLDVITAHSVDRQALENAFGIDVSRAVFKTDSRCTVPLNLPRYQRWKAQAELANLMSSYPLTILNSFELPDLCSSARGILLNHSAVTNSLKLSKGSALESIFPYLTSRGRTQLDVNRRVRSWTQVITNSEFTRQSFRRLWARDSQVIYPPIRVGGRPAFKDKPLKIVGCGFFSGLLEENQVVCGIKRQDLLIEAFKRLIAGGLKDIELILTGHYEESALNRQALEDLRQRAEDLPIRFLLNVPHHQLLSIFQESRLFWQATGFDRDPLEQVGMVETFGMAMVEAMGCGCVPLAFKAGGAPEVIAPVGNCLLWNTLDDLCRESARLLSTSETYEQLGVLAYQRAQEFSLQRFEEAWIKRVDELWN